MSWGRDHFPIIYRMTSLLSQPVVGDSLELHLGRLCSSASAELTLKASNLFPSCAQFPVHNSSQQQPTAGGGWTDAVGSLLARAVKPYPSCPALYPASAVDVVAVVGHFLMTLSTLSQFVLGHRTQCLAQPRAFEPNSTNTDTCCTLSLIIHWSFYFHTFVIYLK